MRRYALIAVGVLLLVLLLAALFLHFRPAVRTSFTRAFDPLHARTAQIDYWNSEIEALGPKKAYENLHTDVKEMSDIEQHVAAHAFGRALYQTQGLSGFSVCDDSLSGGCQHEFLAAVIEADGVSEVTRLNGDCITAFPGIASVSCQHGIGHGLLSFFGYDEKGLGESVTECAKLESLDQTRGCMGGAYMEYNLRQMVGYHVREFDKKKPYAPCDSIAEAYKSACYFWLPPWWRESVFNNDRSIATHAAIGAYCRALPEPYAKSCFSGIGYIAGPSAGLVRSKVRELCNAVSDRQKDKDACWEVASSVTLTDD